MNYCFELKLHSRFCFVLNSTKQNLTVWTAVGSLAMDPTAVHMLVLCIESHLRCDCRLTNVIFPSRQRHSVVNLVCNLQWVSGNHSASSFFVVLFYLFQAQGTNTIMCNEFGETIAIIATSEGEELPLEQALEIYQTAMENSMAAERLQLLWGQTDVRTNTKQKKNNQTPRCILLSPNWWV